MNNEIFVITGTSGTGKTSVIPYLKKSLGNNFQIYDFDTILRPYDFTKEWELEVMNHCFQVFQSEQHKHIVLLGLIRPWKFLEYVEKKNCSKKTNLLLLDITEKIREERLRKRDARNSLILDTEELFSFRKWFDEKNLPILDTSRLSISEVTENIKYWIEESLR